MLLAEPAFLWDKPAGDLHVNDALKSKHTMRQQNPDLRRRVFVGMIVATSTTALLLLPVVVLGTGPCSALELACVAASPLLGTGFAWYWINRAR